MTTLADFLLARIAEDEAPTWTLSPYACAPGCCAPEGWVGAQCRYCDPAPVYGGTVAAITRIAEEHAETVHQRTRVLAECEAKRRIVELHRAEAEQHWVHELDGPDHQETEYSCVICGWFPPGSACDTLRLLALPYADHPDYREEWKP